VLFLVPALFVIQRDVSTALARLRGRGAAPPASAGEA